jgi:voltage-gated potassium channel Kch
VRTRRVVTTVLLLCVAVAGTAQIWSARTWAHRSWAMSEWLIDYSGGFVRRGLPGAVLRLLSQLTSVPANLLAIASSVLVFVLLLGLVYRRGRGVLSTAVLLSAATFGAPAFAGFLVRKDTLGLLVLLVTLELGAKTARQAFTVNLLAAAMLLSHEAFAFYGLPVLMLTCGVRAMLPSLAVAVIAFVCHGDEATAQAINTGWRPLFEYLAAPGCCEVPAAAIDALSWSSTRALALSLTELSRPVALVAWPVTMLLASWAVVSSAVEASRPRLLGIVLGQGLVVAPLFLAGWDFGRWVFLWLGSSVITFLVAPTAWSAVSSRLTRVSVPQFPAPALLVLGIPECCWTVAGALGASPLGALLRALADGGSAALVSVIIGGATLTGFTLSTTGQ